MISRFALALLPALLLTASARAEIVRIPPDLEPTPFQRAVDSAAYGDTVVVPPGEYLQIILRSGLTVISEAGPEKTILRSVLANDVDSLAVLDGFHLKGKARPVAVVFAENSAARIRNCVIEDAWSGIQVQFGDVRIENTTITDCDHGVWFFEAKGLVTGCDISQCINGITLVSSSPRIIRSDIRRNTTGIRIKDWSDPAIGGSIGTMNRIWQNQAAQVRNEAFLKDQGVRTQRQKTLRAPYNFWGDDCTTADFFYGDVEFSPWVDATGKRSLEECPTADG